MKIAFVRTASNVLKYGGYNIQEIGLAKALLRYGISTDVYARFSNISENVVVAENGDCHVVVRPLKGIQIYREIMYYPSLQSDLCNGGYDFVQLLDDSQMMLPILFKSLKKRGVGTILWQGMYRDFSGKAAFMMQKAYDFVFAKTIDLYSDIKIAKTDSARQYLEKKHYHNIRVLPVGLDRVRFTENKSLETEVKEFKQSHKKVILYIGAIEKRRNVDFIVDLFNKLDHKEVGLILIGNGSEYDNIVNKINHLNLDDHCLVYKSIPNAELSSVYEQSDLFLLPTNYEIYGMVIMEALFFGVPVISTQEAGPLSILSDSLYGQCLELDAKLWLNTINSYLSKGVNEEEKMARKQYVEQTFRWESIAESYYQIVKELQ